MDFKKVLKNAQKKIQEENEKRKERAREKREIEEVQKAEFEKQLKLFEQVLDKFEMPDLKDFCTNVLGTEPPEESEDDDDGRRRVIKPDRKTFVDFISDYFENAQLKLSQIKDFAINRGIVSPSFFGIESIEAGKRSEFENIINSIRANFQPENIRNEEHLQAQLTVFLRAKFPDIKVEREMQTRTGDKLDIVVDGKYVLELKVPKRRTDLRNLSAQLEEYCEDYPNLCAVIADISDTAIESSEFDANISQYIQEYSDKYKQKFKVTTVVLNVNMRR